MFDLLHLGEAIRSVVHYQPQDTMTGPLPDITLGGTKKRPEPA